MPQIGDPAASMSVCHSDVCHLTPATATATAGDDKPSADSLGAVQAQRAPAARGPTQHRDWSMPSPPAPTHARGKVKWSSHGHRRTAQDV